MNFLIGFELGAKITLIMKDKERNLKNQLNWNFFDEKMTVP